MNWWQNLRNNPLARLGAVLLLIFYTVALFAEFVAPYDPLRLSIKRFIAATDSDLFKHPRRALYRAPRLSDYSGPGGC